MNFIQVAVVLEADIVLVAIQVGELTASMLASQEHVSANESHWLSELLYWVIYSPLEMKNKLAFVEQFIPQQRRLNKSGWFNTDNKLRS